MVVSSPPRKSAEIACLLPNSQILKPQPAPAHRSQVEAIYPPAPFTCPPCQRCGGQVLFMSGEINECLQCGAEHDKKFKYHAPRFSRGRKDYGGNCSRVY